MTQVSAADQRAAGKLTAWMEVYTRGLFIASAGIAQLATARPDPDVQGIDLLLTYPRASLGVQLKSSYIHRFNSKGTLSFPIEQAWADSWREQDIPPRLVLYLLERTPQTWCRTRALGEFHRAVPYWARLEKSVSAPSVIIERTNRFTVATLATWGGEVDSGMGGKP